MRIVTDAPTVGKRNSGTKRAAVLGAETVSAETIRLPTGWNDLTDLASTGLAEIDTIRRVFASNCWARSSAGE